ncbi:MAG: hypothetical protein M1511_07415 [Deltaproteobacteria bacterium]|nr:hypothetical protein [Deltaproteobacteria bacterium]
MIGTEVIDLTLEGGSPVVKIRYRDRNVEWAKPQRLVNSAGVDAFNLAGMVDAGFPLKTAFIRDDSMKFRRGACQELHCNGTNIHARPESLRFDAKFWWSSGRAGRLCDKRIHLVGIDSPGFTSGPAIARYVCEDFF